MNYIARNKITGLYFDGTAFNGTKEEANWIEESSLPIFKITWGFYEGGNGELIPAHKPEYILRKEEGYLIRSCGEYDWSFIAKPIRWTTLAGAERNQRTFGGKIICLA